MFSSFSSLYVAISSLGFFVLVNDTNCHLQLWEVEVRAVRLLGKHQHLKLVEFEGSGTLKPVNLLNCQAGKFPRKVIAMGACLWVYWGFIAAC